MITGFFVQNSLHRTKRRKMDLRRYQREILVFVVGIWYNFAQGK